MKKILSAALLSLAAMAITAPAAKAGTFGLFTCGGWCCKGCCFHVRPYNAFSPVCCGSVTMDGPVNAHGGGGYGSMNLNYGGVIGGGDCGCAMVPMEGAPEMAMGMPMPPQAPMAVPQAPQGPYYGVQPAAYYPAYYPGYYYPAPMGPMPNNWHP